MLQCNCVYVCAYSMCVCVCVSYNVCMFKVCNWVYVCASSFSSTFTNLWLIANVFDFHQWLELEMSGSGWQLISAERLLAKCWRYCTRPGRTNSLTFTVFSILFYQTWTHGPWFNTGICTLSRKMTSFRQSKNIVLRQVWVWVRVKLRVRVKARVSENMFSIKRVFEQVQQIL